MKNRLLVALLLSGVGCCSGGLLKKSEVVFMYQTDRQTYADYGGTVLAWGGPPTPQALAEAKGLTFFGSVGMVTEFARYYERFPDRYEEGLCRDVFGRPIKVPWLTDHQHKGIPFWWCCTQQPLFRQYLRERVLQTVQAGADGVHIDDHLGSAGGLWIGACFCDRCVAGFRVYLQNLPAAERAALGHEDWANFNYRDYLRQWLAQQGERKIAVEQRPLYPQWRAYQCREAARFMQELRETAAQTAGHPVPMSANAGLLWPLHLVDYQVLDFFSAEIEHHAHEQRFSDLPLLAYRLADAMGRPLASTASGQDWAFIKQRNLPGLVRGWIALSYAAGNCLMTPVHQWCYTPEKGTHWYLGPKEKFAPLYRFVRQHASLFDGFETYADLDVVFPHQSFVAQRETWFKTCSTLAAANVSYRLLVGGDALIQHPLPAEELGAARKLLVISPKELTPSDQALLTAQRGRAQVFTSAEQAIAGVVPAVRVQAPGAVRVLPRVKPGAAVVHLLNYEYDPARDDVRTLQNVQVTVDHAKLSLPSDCRCQCFTPDSGPVELPIGHGAVTVPSLGLWTVLLWTPREP